MRKMLKIRRKLPLSWCSAPLQSHSLTTGGFYFIVLHLNKSKRWRWCFFEFEREFFKHILARVHPVVVWCCNQPQDAEMHPMSHLSAVHKWLVSVLWLAELANLLLLSCCLCSVASKTKFFENASRHVGRYVKYLTSPVWLFQLLTNITKG